MPPKPEPQDEEPQEKQREESEVLEERRRGAEEASPDEDGEGLYWWMGPRLDALRGQVSFVVGGRVHGDITGFADTSDIRDTWGEPDNGTSLRRAFLEMGGVISILEFAFWLNFSDEFELFGGDNVVPTSVNYRNVFVGVRGVPVVGGVRAGYFKEPFGLEEITSSNDITFMERSLTDAFVERRNLGVMLHRRFTEERQMTAAVGFFQEANNDLETAEGYGVAARITAAPLLSEDGRRVIHLGVGGKFRLPPDDNVRFVSRPESAQAPVVADTGIFTAEREVRLAAEAAVVLGSWSVQSEYMMAFVDGDGANDPDFHSVYGMVSWVLTGEHRSYREGVGAFGSVHPETPLFSGGFGAIELAARYSYLDLEADAISGGRLHGFTAGLNWYVLPNVRSMFNYVLSHPEGAGDLHIFQARMQVSF